MHATDSTLTMPRRIIFVLQQKQNLTICYYRTIIMHITRSTNHATLADQGGLWGAGELAAALEKVKATLAPQNFEDHLMKHYRAKLAAVAG
jgi:hypothetical protein